MALLVVAGCRVWRSWPWNEDTVFDCEEGGSTAGGNADLRVDVLYVVIRGLRCDHESVGDLPGGKAEGQQPEYFDLPSGESGR